MIASNNPLQPGSFPVPAAPKPAVKQALLAAEQTQAPASVPDTLQTRPLAQSAQKMPTLSLVETAGPKLGLKASEPQHSKNPWKITSMHVNAGYIVKNDILHTGPMQIQNPGTGTDLTITGLEQKERTSFEYLQIKKGQRFAPDEPQFNLGVNLGFENKFGLELDLKHNKITAAGYDQVVHFEGQMNGEEVNTDAPLNTYLRQHEQTFGNMEISLLGTRSFDLPAPANHRFSFITKAGPSLQTSTTRTALLNPQGEFEQTTSPLGVAGYGFELENALRYELGPKAGRLGLEVGHAFSYLNYARYSTVGGGTGSHDALASQWTVKLTKTIPFKK
ncbi:hypothetical protein COW36_17765 [bacterium (Candidatus Blackallbacteria) CG17_big_fil_post_rev_8_21_14_2_50_48_46]|uniref:Outer membrane protein beta-barrel domain-containing protein n=1 Tax=bacterium (Candidatus Blackallbacteria) CG17_big_fil_post_rev_8_21_14_2_50_48_46 TaxID=2014261 RepID=A0A2M7G0M4_9BACT|nr:MAG: hypothetical protein COW64_00960 [bacterium (Candidatus Blackallbacteria) CG18_big_fil_WC_8_21_14_2_50_49_26]PIW15264.1 MAG: hypothetical protein COW36_17765 [bacterium (Candidatus Blackallbacteria) CG17_big_fil_post_rev_8_21_14_2_50_48_46]PIW45227.1 MAG: hypothetical protein COW20_21250 [bacterium (Candidatus Blackallbacteria) CG13_big_fil_rev_8_21_14_2_50_49_14]